jgi:hypothetical protein
MSKTVKILTSLVLISLLAVIALAALTPGSVFAAALEGRGGPGGRSDRGSITPPGTDPSLTPLSPAEAEGLQRAILEEYGAYNLYQAVNAQLGPQLPFTTIARSEQQHVQALIRQAEKYGVPVPANPGLTNPPAFSNLAEACTLGANAEIADAALYDELKANVTHSDLLFVYNRLQSASLNQHLPAFQACMP